MTEFGGCDMPLHYGNGTLAEHMACRGGSVVFDVSHLGSVKVSGPGTFATLQKSFTNDLHKISPGRAQYTHLLDETGSVLDDIIVWWIAEHDFLVVPNASNTDRVRAAVGGIDVTEESASGSSGAPKPRSSHCMFRRNSLGAAIPGPSCRHRNDLVYGRWHRIHG